jgi:hypothetical protein
MEENRNVMFMTWAEFKAGLTAANVEIREINDPPNHDHGAYLYRQVNGKPRWATLPRSYSDDDVVGQMVFYNICRRLEVKTTKYFKGWYIPL